MSDQAPDPAGTDPPDPAQALRCMDDARTLHEALGVVRALEHASTRNAGASLRDVGRRAGYPPVCVARELLHLVFPATHPVLPATLPAITSAPSSVAADHPPCPAVNTPGRAVLLDEVQRRWRWPLHQLRRPDHVAGARVWAHVRAPEGVVASPRPRLN